MTTEGTVHAGLRGIMVAETALSLVDGTGGRLLIAGYDGRELAARCPYEDVAYLLWHGRFPDETERKALRERLARGYRLPEYVVQIIETLPEDVEMMAALRTAVSALGRSHHQFPPTADDAAALTAAVTSIVAYRYRYLQGGEPVEPDPRLGHAANYLYMLTGKRPSEAHATALNAYFILTAEHGMNASTFAARVTLSTESDIVSALISAIGTMKGPLHGGAPHKVSQMLAEIGQKENAESYLRDLLEGGGRIMGFGHRVYRTRDPRADALATLARQLADDDQWLDLAAHVEQTALRLLAEQKPGRELHTNVEFYAAAVLRAVGIPPELYTPTFSVARTAGWTAHLLEQGTDNQLIRPASRYVGPRRTFDR